MKKQKRVGLLNKKISNRLSYTIIAFVSLMLVGIFVFAAAPDPGHDYNDLDLGPITIEDGKVGIGMSPDYALDVMGDAVFNNEISVESTSEFHDDATFYGKVCIWDSCIDSWSDIGGSGGTPTLAQVLAVGADADRMIDMNSHDIADVHTLNLVNTGKITADDGTVDVQGKLSVGTGLSVGGNINTLGSITPNGGLCLSGVCKSSWPSGGASHSYIDWTDCEHKKCTATGGNGCTLTCSSGYKVVDQKCWATNQAGYALECKADSPNGDKGYLGSAHYGMAQRIMCCKLVTP